MYVHIYVHTHIYNMHVCVYKYVHKYTHTYVLHTHTYVYTYVYVHTHIYNMLVYIYINMCINIHIHRGYIHTPMYIHLICMCIINKYVYKYIQMCVYIIVIGPHRVRAAARGARARAVTGRGARARAVTDQGVRARAVPRGAAAVLAREDAAMMTKRTTRCVRVHSWVLGVVSMCVGVFETCKRSLLFVVGILVRRST